MGVDERRDHSLRVPRPDLSVKIGTPNACNGCHADRSARWAAGTVARWFGEGRSKRPHYGEAIQAGRAGLPGAMEALAALAEDREEPAIVRATAVSLLLRYPGPGSLSVLERSLVDADPLIRLAAASTTESVDPAELPRLLSPRLADPIRGVRLEAARVLASGPVSSPDLEAALAEYRQAQEINADRPESRLNLGWLRAREGDPEGAAAHFAAALGLDPTFIPAYVNLADLYRLRGRDDEGERLLRRAASLAPGDARVRHALGLLLIRAGRLPEAVGELEKAVQLEPREPRYAYAYRLAVGAYGGGLAVGSPTPNVDQLAREGLMLTSSYAQPSCSPTRATIHTGQLPIQHGVLSPPMYGDPGGITPESVTLPMLLKRQGYVTRGVGKWHMGEGLKNLPSVVGYDEYFGFLDVSDMYTEWRDPAYNPEVALDEERTRFMQNRAFNHYLILTKAGGRPEEQCNSLREIVLPWEAEVTGVPTQGYYKPCEKASQDGRVSISELRQDLGGVFREVHPRHARERQAVVSSTMPRAAVISTTIRARRPGASRTPGPPTPTARWRWTRSSASS